MPKKSKGGKAKANLKEEMPFFAKKKSKGKKMKSKGKAALAMPMPC